MVAIAKNLILVYRVYIPVYNIKEWLKKKMDFTLLWLTTILFFMETFLSDLLLLNI